MLKSSAFARDAEPTTKVPRRKAARLRIPMLRSNAHAGRSGSLKGKLFGRRTYSDHPRTVRLSTILEAGDKEYVVDAHDLAAGCRGPARVRRASTRESRREP